MTETPRHLQWLLPKAEIDALTAEQRKERRTHLVNERLKRAEQKLTTTRRKRMARFFRQWFHAEIMRHTAVDSSGSPINDIRRWLRQEYAQATRDAYKGFSADAVVETVVRQEVSRALQGLSGVGASGRTSAAYASGMKSYIAKIVEEEVRKQVLANMTFEVAIRGHAHSSAKGLRAIQIMGEDDEKG